MSTSVNVSDTATAVETIGSLIKALPSSWSVPLPLDYGETCGTCNQPKTIVGNDGYCYVFYQDTGDYISYSYSQDGITWTPMNHLIGDADILDGSQFSVWYDKASNTIALARTSAKDLTSFYWSVGTLSAGTITWNQFDQAQPVTNQEGVYLPSVFFGLNHLYTSNLLWVSVTTSPDNIAFYNEVWMYTYGNVSPVWSNVKTDLTDNYDNALTIILGAHGNGSVILARGGYNSHADHITFFTTESDGVGAWAGPYTTTNTYDLSRSGYTLGYDYYTLGYDYYADTIFISAIGADGEGEGLYLVWLNSDDDSYGEIFIPTYLLGIEIEGGATISSDPYGLTIATADINGGMINVFQSRPWNEFNPSLLNWMPPQVIWTSPEASPSTPQMFFREVAGSALRTVLAWEASGPSIYATILNPSVPATVFTGITDIVTGYDYITVYSNTHIGLSDSAIALDYVGVITPSYIEVGDDVFGLDWLGIISVPFGIDDSATAVDSIVAYLANKGVSDSAIAIESIGVSGKFTSVVVYDVAFGYDYISAGIPITGLIDQAYAQDNISVQRFCTFNPFSGAISLTPMDTDYIALTYRQMIDMVGIPILYRTQHILGHGPYEHPIITYTDSILNAFITIFTNVEYEYVEEGFLPNHYANMWIYCVAPQVGDHVVWQGIEWEVRNSIPKVIGNKTIYYQTILRRVLGNVPPATPVPNTLNSGGVASLPIGDP